VFVPASFSLQVMHPRFRAFTLSDRGVLFKAMSGIQRQRKRHNHFELGTVLKSDMVFSVAEKPS
jgi:hypothetical protein